MKEPTPAQYALFMAIQRLPFNPLESTPALLELIMQYDRVRTEQIESLQAQVMNLIRLSPAPVYAVKEPKCPLCLR